MWPLQISESVGMIDLVRGRSLLGCGPQFYVLGGQLGCRVGASQGVGRARDAIIGSGLGLVIVSQVYCESSCDRHLIARQYETRRVGDSCGQ